MARSRTTPTISCHGPGSRGSSGRRRGRRRRVAQAVRRPRCGRRARRARTTGSRRRACFAAACRRRGSRGRRATRRPHVEVVRVDARELDLAASPANAGCAAPRRRVSTSICRAGAPSAAAGWRQRHAADARLRAQPPRQLARGRLLARAERGERRVRAPPARLAELAVRRHRARQELAPPGSRATRPAAARPRRARTKNATTGKTDRHRDLRDDDRRPHAAEAQPAAAGRGRREPRLQRRASP